MYQTLPNQTQPVRSAKLSSAGSRATARRLWEVMGKIYGQQWIAKNGAVPDELWMAQIGSLTSDQMKNVCNSLVSRCSGGNTWPPSLAEFVALVADAGGGRLGITTAEVMAEYRRWRNESYRYDSSESFPWRHPVLYQICTELRRTGVERQMAPAELESFAAVQLSKWEKHLATGKPVPPVRKQIAAPRHAAGPTPAQILLEQYKARKAAGFI